MPLLIVQAFVNTRDLEQESDLLDDPATARRWFQQTGLLDRRADLSPSDLEQARAVREALRAMLIADREVKPGELAPLRALAAAHKPILALAADGAMSLEHPERETVSDALFELLLIVRAAQEDGSLARLKVCANAECLWAYFDRSRNQQGSWCDMAVCGNRIKNRQLRARRG